MWINIGVHTINVGQDSIENWSKETFLIAQHKNYYKTAKKYSDYNEN